MAGGATSKTKRRASRPRTRSVRPGGKRHGAEEAARARVGERRLRYLLSGGRKKDNMAASGDTAAFTLYDALVRTPMAHSAFTDEVRMSTNLDRAKLTREQFQNSMTVSGAGGQLHGIEYGRLVLWDTFDADVAPEPTEAAIFAKQVPPVCFFETARRRRIPIGMNEEDAFILLDRCFIRDCLDVFNDPDFGLNVMEVNFMSHPTVRGARPDALWTRFLDSENSVALSPDLFGTEYGAGNNAILAHEHKSPFKFPYKATFDEMLNDAVDFLTENDPHFDEHEEYSKHATWMIANRLHQYYAEHGLVGFSESVTRDTSISEGRKDNLLYPIRQVYAYMLRNFCRFGVLSTTNITWFLKLEPDNTLKITKGYDCTGNTEATNPKFAYFRLLLKASKGSRLTLDSTILDGLGSIANLNVAGSPWKEIYDQIVAARAGTASDSGAGAGAIVGRGAATYQVSAGQPGSITADVLPGGGGAATDGDGDDDEARLNFLRQTLPLAQSVFPYYGGMKDLLCEGADAYGHLMSVNTGGLQQLIAVKTPEIDPYRDRDDETEQEEMRLLQAFTNEIEVYETLRPLWGSRHVPWFLYGGRHLFSDFIVATTWEGESLKSHFRKPSQYTKAVVDKARETLLMVHGLGVALRVNEPEDLASTFVMDDHGEVRLTRFRNATIKATPVELAQDIQDFNAHFILEE